MGSWDGEGATDLDTSQEAVLGAEGDEAETVISGVL